MAAANEGKDGDSVPKNWFGGRTRYVLLILGGALCLSLLYFLSRENYLLFHSAVEVFTIVITFAIFAIAWNSRRMMDNNYLLFVGIVFLFVGGLDLLHTLAYKGMGVFPDVGANLATQLWIATRFMASFSFLIALLFVRRKFNPVLAVAGCAIVTGLVLSSIFYFGVFPTAYVDGVGLTPFKIASEYAISFVFLASIALLVRNRSEFSSSVFKLIIAALAVGIATEMSFTLYTDVYGVANMLGHLLDVVSFYLIYKALIETGLTRPYDLLFRNLKQSEEELTAKASELSATNTRLLEEAARREALQEKLENNAAQLEEYAANMEALAAERAEQLKDAERLAAIGQTAGMVGHDIRNPLQSIIGELYLAKGEVSALADGEAKNNLGDSIAIIEEQLVYVNKIVADLQDFAKPAKPIVEQVNLERSIEEALSLVQVPESVRAKHSVVGKFRAFTSDASYVKRILTNLILNAVQAMPNGGNLLIRGAVQSGKVLISVADTGEGIPEEAQKNIFKPMFTTKSKGQGFGLAVCKKLTQALGGTITFTTKCGKGTKFVVELPASEPT
jgi:signal transduction histidine kinase